jgi:hypothetical protein
MMEIGIDEWDAADILSRGFDCSRSSRKSFRIERCLQVGRKIIRIVAALGPYNFNGKLKEVFFIIHASKETLKKDRMKEMGR